MISFDDKGIYCAVAGIYIDPWQPVDKAIITHAHFDHARPGMGAYLAHRDAIPVLKFRLGEEINVESREYGETFSINGVKFSLHPAGHIWGSAQVRIEYKGQVWVVSGDYKLQNDGISIPFEPIRCHSFITESTFGLPVYNFPSVESVQEDMNAWWRQNRDEGRNSVILAYALGKAQRVLQQLDTSIGKIYTHGAVDNINKVYERSIGPLQTSQRIEPATDRKEIKGAMIIAPPSVLGTTWLRKLDPYKLGMCSGWMQLRGARRRRGADRGFVMSDHADWQQLNRAVKETGAQDVYVTHGYKSVFAKWLEEAHGLNAREVETLYAGEQADEAADTLAKGGDADEGI